MALTSAFGNIYQSVLARLTERATLLKHIDEDNGQLELDPKEYRVPLLFPCALIEMGQFIYTEMQNDNLQMAEGMIQIRVAYAPYSTTNAKTPNAYREMALGNYEVEKQVVDVLHKWAPPGCTRLLRRSSVKEGREMDTMRVRILNFATSFTEIIGDEEYTLTTRPEPGLYVNIFKQV